MDRSHKLDAPNNDELSTIEQIEDHSGTSTLYRNPGEQFEGSILSASEREKVRAEKYNSISRDIWKSSFKLGLYVPFPFISGILLAAFLYNTVSWTNASFLIGLIIIAVGIWALLSYFAYARIFKIFYKHGLRTIPFLTVMLLSIFISSQAIYNVVVTNFAGQSLVFNIALIAIFIIVYSILATFIILLAWGNTKLKVIFKILAPVGVIAISGLFVAATYLL